ncbi:MAG: trehalose-phosphatase [Nitrospirales bacterium]|nr:trehalose-phosphatase [Nitrospirales bacterium]
MKKEPGPHYFFGTEEPVSRISRALQHFKIALFFDFDGTLVPLQNDPAHCMPSEETKALLQSLADSPLCFLMILSGRSLPDLQERIGLSGIYYGGNHGLDIAGPDVRYTHPDAVLLKRAIHRVGRKLESDIAGIRGAWIENKEFTLALHYRNVGEKDIPLVQATFEKAADTLSGKGAMTVIKGKKVLELAPGIRWNKGAAALWMLKQWGDLCLPIAVGDDQTDETVFHALGGMGLCIRIGKSKTTHAQYYLKGSRETLRLMREVKRHVEKARSPSFPLP